MKLFSELYLEGVGKESLVSLYEALCEADIHRLRILRIASRHAEYRCSLTSLCNAICRPDRVIEHIVLAMPPPELIDNAASQVADVLQVSAVCASLERLRPSFRACA